MRTAAGESGRAGRLLAAAVALALVVSVLYLARPSTVWTLLVTIDPTWLAAAAVASAAAVALRGVRLVVLLQRGELGFGTGTMVAAAAQAAALFAPIRLGELALPWLLRRATGRDLSSAVGTLVAVRALDVAALALWAGSATLVTWGTGEPIALAVSAVLLAVPAAVPLVLGWGDRLAVRFLASSGRTGRRWADRIHRLVVSVSELHARPGRLVTAAVASLAMWGCLWLTADLLLVGMGYRWPLSHVVVGSAMASLSGLVPITVVGNVGPLEAGWTAAFTVLGVPVDVAAATGLATHLWSLALVALYGAVGWLALTRSRPV